MSEKPQPALSSDELPTSRGSNFYVLVFGVVMLVGLLALAWIGRPPRSVAVGQPLPRLDLLPLLHVEEPLSADDLSGKFVVLHFWGTWCPPCAKEFPEFVELANDFADDPQVVIASVSCSGGPEYDLEKLYQQTAKFMEQHDATLPTYADPAAMTRQGLALLLPNGSFGYPTTILVDREGVIAEVLEGYLPGEMQELRKTIRDRIH